MRWAARNVSVALESGAATSFNDLIARVGKAFSYIAGLRNLTTLAPQLVTTISDDTLPSSTTANDLAPPPLLWSGQIEQLERSVVRCAGSARLGLHLLRASSRLGAANPSAAFVHLRRQPGRGKLLD